jgi:hypothetical protein
VSASQARRREATASIGSIDWLTALTEPRSSHFRHDPGTHA